MRCRHLDFALLVLIVLPAVYLMETAALCGPPCSNHCAQIYYVAEDDGTPNGWLCFAFKTQDCSFCGCTLCECQTLPFAPNCVATINAQQIASVDKCDLSCALNINGFSQAQNPQGIGAYQPLGYIQDCQH
jgi:hypothetical protein